MSESIKATEQGIPQKPIDTTALSSEKITGVISTREAEILDTIGAASIAIMVASKKHPIPTSPASPLLSKPENDVGAIESESIASNPWLSEPSFLAIFNGIMSILMKMNSENRKLQADFAIDMTAQTIELSKNTADLSIKLSYQRAMDLYSQATSAFAGAAISVGQLGSTIYNESAAKNSERVTALDKQKTDNQNELKIVQDKLDGKYIPPGGVVSGSSSSSSAAAPATFPKPDPGSAEEAALNAEKTKLVDKQVKLSNEYDTALAQERMMRNEKTKTISEITSQLKEGSFSIWRGTIQEKEGALQAAKDVLEGYRSAMQTFLNNVISNRDSSKNDIDALARFIKEITEAEYRAHAIRQG